MKLCATILARNEESTIADAIASVVDWVDMILLIDTGVVDSTLSIAESASKGKLVARQFSWCDHLGMARNFAVYQASALGSDWTLTIDSGERMEWPGFSNTSELKAALQANDSVRLWHVRNVDGCSASERFIRLPVGTQQQWTGEIYASFTGLKANQSAILSGVVYCEVSNRPEARRIQCEQELVRLARFASNNPTDGRNWFYLGRVRQELGQYRDSMEAYRKCVKSNQVSRELAAAAAYLAASIAVELKDYEEALVFCGLGLAREVHWPELFWLAGFCNYHLDRFSECVVWENLAISLGHFRGIGVGKDRTIHRHLPAWFEGPFEVLKFTFEKLGQVGDMREAIRLFEEAKIARLSLETHQAKPSTQTSL
ncbi:MAG: hypothetical protein SGI77_22585 [Pirellulaceae bacterium]|nr:hypothetical protein [Pirellulaceae bacterium]